MKCVKVELTDRRISARRVKSASGNRDAPRRICQIRMADPSHEEDPRWKQGPLERFHFDSKDSLEQSVASSETAESNEEVNNEMYLSVLNLNLSMLSVNSRNSALRQSFKYKTYPRHCNYHRMFVRQSIAGHELDYNISDTQSSVNMDCRINDFMEDILSINSSQSSPSFSNICAYNVYECSNNQEDLKCDTILEEPVITSEAIDKIRNTNKNAKEDIEIEYVNNSIRNYAVKYQKSGKIRSLTISRTQSPETVQVIRVDVMCHYSEDASEASDNVGDKPLEDISKVKTEKSKKIKGFTLADRVELKPTSRRHDLYNKIVLSSTTKRKDKCGDEEFPLLCKTFKYCDRDDRLSVWKSRSYSKII